MLGDKKKNVWDREEIRQDKNREGQRASRKHRPILQMTHVWIILVLLFLLFNDKFTTPRESKRSRYRCPNCIINVLVALTNIPAYSLCLEACSSDEVQFTESFNSPQLKKMFVLKSLFCVRDGSPSLDHSAERTVFQPLLPAASLDPKKDRNSSSWSNLTGHVNLTTVLHRTSSALKILHVCISISYT